MKRIFFSGLLMAVLAGTALAQQPMYYQQVPAGGPTMPAVPATATHGTVIHGGCSSGCCTPTQTICVPEQTCKEKKTPIYGKTCEPFCVPACHCCLHSLFGGDSGCGGCDSGCGAPLATSNAASPANTIRRRILKRGATASPPLR